MFSWLSSLFNRCEKSSRKKRVHLTSEQRSNLVTDRMINKMTCKNIANKYNVSVTTVRNILNEARRVQ